MVSELFDDMVFYVLDYPSMGFLKRNRTFFLTLTGIILFFISREIRAEQSFSFIAGVMFAVHDWKERYNGKMVWCSY